MKPAQTQLKVLKGYQASAPAVSKGLPRTCRAAPRQRAQGLQQQNPRFRSEGRDRPPNPTAPSCARGEPRRASRTGPAIPESDSGQPRAPSRAPRAAQLGKDPAGPPPRSGGRRGPHGPGPAPGRRLWGGNAAASGAQRREGRAPRAPPGCFPAPPPPARGRVTSQGPEEPHRRQQHVAEHGADHSARRSAARPDLLRRPGPSKATRRPGPASATG